MSSLIRSSVADWAAASNVELAYTPFYGWWLNRIEAQLRVLRYFTLAGTDQAVEQFSVFAATIRRWLNDGLLPGEQSTPSGQ